MSIVDRYLEEIVYPNMRVREKPVAIYQGKILVAEGVGFSFHVKYPEPEYPVIYVDPVCSDPRSFSRGNAHIGATVYNVICYNEIKVDTQYTISVWKPKLLEFSACCLETHQDGIYYFNGKIDKKYLKE